MKKSKLGALSVVLPLSLGLSLALAACGGSSDNDGDNGGSGESSSAGKPSSGGTNASTAGSSSKAGNTSSGGTSNSPGNGSNVPGNTPLGELTDDQFEQVCQDFSEKFSGDEFEDANCRLAGVLGAILAQSDEQAQELCSTAYTECKTTPPDTTETCEKPSSECTATVDEINACMDDMSEAFAGFNDAIPSCDTLTRDAIGTLFTQLGGGAMLPASCETYQEKCPDGPMAETGEEP